MKREDFERLKEDEKKHLREIRALKQRLKEAQRMQRIGRAMHDVQSAGDLDGFEASLEELERKALEQEARLDMAIDSSDTRGTAELPEPDEEALKLARAAAFVQRMKVSMGEKPEIEETKSPSQSGANEKEGAPSDSEEPGDFEKTIGRMTPREKKK
jgi:phage shock protein A